MGNFDVTTCKTCKRAVYQQDVDEFGNCVNCRAASAAPEPGPEDEDEDDRE